MVTACIVLLYISYCIPVVALLIKGRNNIKHGPFWLGKFGLFTNCVLLVWTMFTLIMYSFPFVKPVSPDSKFLPLFSTLDPLSFPSIHCLSVHTYPCLTHISYPPSNHPILSLFGFCFASLCASQYPLVISVPPFYPFNYPFESKSIQSSNILGRHELRFGSLLCSLCLCALILGTPRKANLPNEGRAGRHCRKYPSWKAYQPSYSRY